MEEDEFIREFMARANNRQAKLAELRAKTRTLQAKAKSEEKVADVSYPQLSPLPEEGPEASMSQAQDKADGTSVQDECSNTEQQGENTSPDSDSELNYSSDLSLECEATAQDSDTQAEVFRAQPVVCHSSPEHISTTTQPIMQSQYNTRQSYSQTIPRSPRKNLNPIDTYRQHEPTAPLQELQPEQKAASSQSLPSSLTDDQMLKELKRKIDRAEQTKSQLKKAVEVSKLGSEEHIEAARLLQITDLEHLAYTNHATMLEKGKTKKSDTVSSLRLSEIRLKMSSRLRNDLAEEGVSHYFFCVASCGTEVKPTEVVDTNDIRNQDLKAYLKFKESLYFTNLSPEFNLKLEVFELIIGQHMPKLLSRLTPSKKSRISPDTLFKRIGSLRLSLSDRDASNKNLMQWSKHEESKYIERECKFNMELRPELLPTKSGMLHVRYLDRAGRPDWIRFWVDLSGGQIKMWGSKQDALDGKKPQQALEIEDLCSEVTQKLTPDDGLYRQNSFVVYSIQDTHNDEVDNLFQRVLKDERKYKMVKHQFAAESRDERDSWCTLLDKSMYCYREWNGKRRVYSIEEAKDLFSYL